MATSKIDIIKVATQYAHLLDRVFDRVEVRLFGSYYKGTAKPESDIDVAVISNDFKHVDYILALQILNRLKLEIDVRLEAIPITREEFENPPIGSIASYIAKESERIAIFN